MTVRNKKELPKYLYYMFGSLILSILQPSKLLTFSFMLNRIGSMGPEDIILVTWVSLSWNGVSPIGFLKTFILTIL